MKKAIMWSMAVLILFSPALIRADELFLGPDSFHPQRSNTDWDRASVESGLEMVAGSSSLYFTAPIHLPHGSKITGYTVFFRDNSTGYIWFHLFRAKQYADPWAWDSIFPQWQTTGASASKQHIKHTNVYWQYNEIRNDSCTYHIIANFSTASEGSNLILYGVKIFYKPPTT